MPPSAAGKTKRRPPGGKRPTAAEVERRLAEVEALLATGAPRHEIVATMRARFGISERSVGSYIRKVRNRWAAESKEASATEREATVARLTKLSRRLEESGAWTALASIERLLADVRGVRGSRRIDLHTELATEPVVPELTMEQAIDELEMLPMLLTDLVQKGEMQPSPSLIRDVDELAAALAAAQPGGRRDSGDTEPRVH